MQNNERRFNVPNRDARERASALHLQAVKATVVRAKARAIYAHFYSDSEAYLPLLITP